MRMTVEERKLKHKIFKSKMVFISVLRMKHWKRKTPYLNAFIVIWSVNNTHLMSFDASNILHTREGQEYEKLVMRNWTKIKDEGCKKLEKKNRKPVKTGKYNFQKGLAENGVSVNLCNWWSCGHSHVVQQNCSNREAKIDCR